VSLFLTEFVTKAKPYNIKGNVSGEKAFLYFCIIIPPSSLSGRTMKIELEY